MSPSKTIDRSIPADLLELARLAIATGLDGVRLGFDLRIPEFAAPIEWSMRLTRTDRDVLLYTAITQRPKMWAEDCADPKLTGQRSDAYWEEFSEIDNQIIRTNHLIVATRIGKEIKAAGPLVGNSPHLGVDEIREWILAEREDVPALTPAEQELLERDAEIMTAAWAQGWTAERSTNRGDTLAMPGDVTGDEEPLVDTFCFAAVNYDYYDVARIEALLENSTPAAYEIRMSRLRETGEWAYCADGRDENRQPITLDPDHALQRVLETPPWHVEMAYFDDDHQEWIL